MRHRTGGFALAAVLWVIVGVAALAMAAQLAAREAVDAARNRADLAVAAWRAEGCAEAARAALSAALEEEGDDARDPAWGRAGRVLAASPLTAGCDVRMRPAGAALDANTADGGALRRLFAALGAPPARADSLADALLDWRDADAEPRPAGAEAAWYLAEGRLPPRDGPLADPRELLRVRGFDAAPGIDTVLGVETGRIALNHAPPAVLASLPGMTPEALARLVDARAHGRPLTDLAELEGALTEGARATLLASFSELSVRTTPVPDAWTLTARAAVGTPPATAVLEVRLVRAGTRAAVVRRRSWTE